MISSHQSTNFLITHRSYAPERQLYNANKVLEKQRVMQSRWTLEKLYRIGRKTRLRNRRKISVWQSFPRVDIDPCKIWPRTWTSKSVVKYFLHFLFYLSYFTIKDSSSTTTKRLCSWTTKGEGKNSIIQDQKQNDIMNLYKTELIKLVIGEKDRRMRFSHKEW